MLAGYRTYIAIGVAALGALLRQYEIEVDEAALVDGILTWGGLVAAVWFRYQVTRKPE